MLNFWFFIILSVIGYSVQNIGLIKYTREYNGLLISIIRNVSLIITGIPLLLLGDISLLGNLGNSWIYIIGAMILGVCNVYLGFQAFSYLPVGIGKPIKSVFKAISAIAIGYVLLSQGISNMEGFILFIILVGVVVLTTGKIDIQHLDKKNAKKGVIFLIIAGLLETMSLYFFKVYSDLLDPWTSTYLLESSIGFGFIILWFVLKLSKKSITSQIPPLKTTLKIAGISSGALVGTVGFAYALQLGSFGLASSLMILVIPFTAILAYFVFGEKLSLRQIIALCIILCGLVALKIL